MIRTPICYLSFTKSSLACNIFIFPTLFCIARQRNGMKKDEQGETGKKNK